LKRLCAATTSTRPSVCHALDPTEWQVPGGLEQRAHPVAYLQERAGDLLKLALLSLRVSTGIGGHDDSPPA
jgi:hypothetical protein